MDGLLHIKRDVGDNVSPINSIPSMKGDKPH